MNLQCCVCKQRDAGACFQCNYKRCAKSFHGSCGLSDGVKYMLDTGEAYCKTHNNYKKEHGIVEGVNIGSFVQFKFNKGVFAGKVVNLNDTFVEVEVYPLAKDIIEVPLNDIFNSNDCFLNQPAGFNYLG